MSYTDCGFVYTVDNGNILKLFLVFEFSCFYCWAVKSTLLLCSGCWRGCCDFSIQVLGCFYINMYSDWI